MIVNNTLITLSFEMLNNLLSFSQIYKKYNGVTWPRNMPIGFLIKKLK